jgi:hypothetical protein
MEEILIEKIFENMVNERVKELTKNEDLQELFYSHFTSINFSVIPKQSILECVILEPRIDRNLRNVLNNFTTILPYASFTIFHSNENENYLKNIIGKHHNFNLRKLPIPFGKKIYSEFLASCEFWEQLHGEKILIFQTDTGIKTNDILSFWDFSYIGAPWGDWVIDNNPKLKIGNGGLSLRDRKAMIDICKQNKIGENIPEDVFFGKHLFENEIYSLPTVSIAYKFAIENNSRSYNNTIDSMGFHQIIDKWDRDFLKGFFSKLQSFNENKITIEKVLVNNVHNTNLLSWLKIGLGPHGLYLKKNTIIPFLNMALIRKWWIFEKNQNKTICVQWKKNNKKIFSIIDVNEDNRIINDFQLV